MGERESKPNESDVENGPVVATYWTDNGYGVLFTNSSGVLYGQNFGDPAVIRIRLNTLGRHRTRTYNP